MIKRTLTLLTAGIVSVALVVQSCQSDETQSTKELYLDLPATTETYFTNTNNDIPTLGRVLFYDRQLSANNSVSCASCHKQELAFADNAAFSTGYKNTLTTRNSMPIQNLQTFFIGGGFDNFNNSSVVLDRGFGSGFPSVSLFWDGREHNLGTMVLKPIVNHIEMGVGDLDALAEKLQSVPYYQDLFLKAYGTNEVTSDRISEALSMFTMSITSRNTKFDRARMGIDKLSALEEKGRQLFIEVYECNACHQTENPTGYIFAGTFANIGLQSEYDDNGVEEVTGNAGDAGLFKIPSLRNVALTGPYMHDGSFETLEDVVDHYSTGIEDHPNLDFRLKDAQGEPRIFNIAEHEKKAIVAFLGTLTDKEMITASRFSNPFKTK
jgi:cytochrome c peroxidase